MNRFLVALAATAGIATATQAGVVTIGSPKSTSCWIAAESKSDARRDLEICNEALAEDFLGVEARAGTYVNRGIIYMNRDEYVAAAADFAKARELDPDQPEAYLNEGILALHQKEAEAALRFADRSLELDTARPHIAYFVRGLAHEDKGEAENAYRDLKMAQSLMPGWYEVERELGRYSVVAR
ncbi:tetratricopeptide repeat protein [Sphingomicrobium aestuariivivum]|uniref:tetratricopeptide repeat protein n=1 Tax=Sphingomicrobium aestuariivivum TaxID=1582356 RepID=UPI001FD66342|nr:tetratricopeptide repeat protein [Sphingomicrobium aestuariivivum]MCJ8189985.1 tetratricopeptide repeat protein [Sphingomicrobium aestuariivivum]